MALEHIYGFHPVTVRLQQQPKSIHKLYYDAARCDQRLQALLKSAQTAKVPCIAIHSQRLQELAGVDRHQGVVAAVQFDTPKLAFEDLLESLSPQDILLALDGVTDPHNLGACLRVASAAGVRAVIAPRDRTAGLTPTVRKVASGAAEVLPYLPVTNLARALRACQAQGVTVVGSSEHASVGLYQAQLHGPLLWVMGAEGPGLRELTRKTCDLLVSIPTVGAVQSLNVSVATGICLFETVRQFQLKKSDGHH